MSVILSKYENDINTGKISKDPIQVNALEKLQVIADKLSQPIKKPKISLWKKLRNSAEVNQKPVLGLYMWGGVGRGKTYLMDLFYDGCTFDKKFRIHFHRFMLMVHDELKTLKGQQDPLKQVAVKLAKQYRLLCLDEFNVTDITDAMILAQLTKHLFNNGVTLVTTSNTVPNNLYKDGLQRESFMPAIDLLNEHTEVFNLDSGIDYRLRTLTKAHTWWVVESSEQKDSADNHFTNLFNELALANLTTAPLVIFQREINVIRRAQGIAWFEFSELCEGPRSVADYIEMSKLFHTIIISNIPIFDALKNDSARRFIEFIDECYDRHVNIIVSAATTHENIYQSTRLKEMFKRTGSRLQEMQSKEYLALEHLA